MKNLMVVFVLLITCNSFAQKSTLPHLKKVNGQTEIIVDGKPFLMFAGELHNSSTGSAHSMRPLWKQMKDKNLNTVIAPVSWELIETVEGEFDFSIVDSMIMGARKENLKLIVLWFGSWKNGKSTYVPEWVKKNTEKYPLMKSRSGRVLNTLSTFGNNSLKADAKAFGKLMSYIKKVDSKEHTVIMVQVQNEVGILGSARDYSDRATRAFEEQVPVELMNYLQKNKETLYPALLKVWEANGFKVKGTWEEVFGKGEKYRGEEWKTNYGYYTEELFMAWNMAKYIGYITQKGKDEYMLPMFANAWIKQPRAKNPGKYPSGGPLPQVIDIWRAAAPAIDLIAADIYAVEEFDWVCKKFSRSENPVFIPETTPDLGGSARALYAFGKYDALCYSPFGIDGNGLFGTADPNDKSLKKVYGVLQNISPYINKYRGTDDMTALFLGGGDMDTQVDIGDYTIYMSRFSSAGLFEKTGGRFGIEGEEDRSPAGLIIIKLDDGEFLVAGGVGGIQVAIKGSKSNKAHYSGYASVDEITFENGEMRSHRLNGDEIALGGAIIKPGEVKVFKIKIYTYQNSEKESLQNKIDSLTKEEKIRLLSGIGMENIPNVDTTMGVVGAILGKVPGAAGGTFPVSRLGIPGIIVADGPAGVRIQPKRVDDTITYYATAFPIGTSLASTWDVELVRKVAKAMGEEVKEYGVDVLLAPALNIQRNPLCGRNFEYYSEDPLISGKIAAAYVNGIQENGVGATIKHFVANNQETSRRKVDGKISQRALREIYLRGFEIAVKEASPWAVMSSYNKVNGTYTSQSSELLTTILRDEWDFDGMVMTDWYSGSDCVSQVVAGNDLLMPGKNTEYKKILNALNDSMLSEDIVDTNLENILKLISKTPTFNGYNYSNEPNLEAHAEIAREAGRDGIILLKNENKTLPTVPKSSIALLGNYSYNTFIGGSGSGEVNEAYQVSLYEGLIKAGFNLDQVIYEKYTDHISNENKNVKSRTLTLQKIKRLPELDLSESLIDSLSDVSECAIFTLGRNAGEGEDRTLQYDYFVSEEELNLINTIADKFHARGKKFIVVLNIDAIVEMSTWDSIPDAILLTWLPGMEAGNAIADIISGKISPSAKLAITIPKKYEDVPSSDTYPSTEKVRQREVLYNEGIFVGYRYYSTFNVKPAYEFGFGLSYTNFEYRDLKLDDTDFEDNLTASVKISNTGNVAGREVVQLYLSAPLINIAKPSRELKGFFKTKLLNPGESQIVEFVISKSDLVSFDTKQSAWVAESGQYKVLIGASSEDIKLKAKFNLSKQLIVKKVANTLNPHVEIKELSRP